MSARFCAACGTALEHGGDRSHRHCTACGSISYANPAVFAGCAGQRADGTPLLCCTRLGPGESIQAAALRALGAGEATRLALYCTLTDLAQGAVYVVFRTRDAGVAMEGCAEALPDWAPPLLERLAADRAAGHLPVYTAAFADGVLRMDAVPDDNGPLSPGPA